MSEVKHRRHLRDFFSGDENLRLFVQVLLESTLPIPEQLRRIFMLDNEVMICHAIFVADNLNLSEMIPDLMQLYNLTTDSTLRHNIIQALGNHEGNEVDQFLVAILREPGDLNYRIFAAYALGRGRRPDVPVDLLAVACNTLEDSALRGWALDALDYESCRSYLPQILLLLQDKETIVRYKALFIVGSAGNATLVSYVEPLINDPSFIKGSETIGKRASKILKQWGCISSD